MHASTPTPTHPHTIHASDQREGMSESTFVCLSVKPIWMLDGAKTDPPLLMKWAYCGNCIFHKRSCLDRYHMFWDRLTCVFTCPGGLEKSQSETDMFICLHSMAESSISRLVSLSAIFTSLWNKWTDCLHINGRSPGHGPIYTVS